MIGRSQVDTKIPEFRTPKHFSLSADTGWPQRFRLAATDIREGFLLWRLIWALALSDIKLRYRGSAIGPFWLTISTAVQISSMGFIFADLFHMNIHVYLPYLAVSQIFWNYLNSIINDGGVCFSQSDTLIKGTRMPFTVHAVRSVVRNTIILFHNIVILIPLYLVVGVHFSPYIPLFIPALILWMITGYSISLLFGAFCARFRDVPQIIMALMQVAYFATPIMWLPSIIKGHRFAEFLIHLNPFFYIMAIVRAPLLGTHIPIEYIWRALAISAAILLISYVGFARTRGRIAYWV